MEAVPAAAAVDVAAAVVAVEVVKEGPEELVVGVPAVVVAVAVVVVAAEDPHCLQAVKDLSKPAALLVVNRTGGSRPTVWGAAEDALVD